MQAAVQKRNSEALSAMTFAATLGDVDSMEHLLQRGLLINTADYDGRTTLHLAALEGNVKVLELLLQEGADPNVRDRHVLRSEPLSTSCSLSPHVIQNVLHQKKVVCSEKDSQIISRSSAVCVSLFLFGNICTDAYT